ncbi:PREDICTED: F-box/LRR-repeat protein At3g59210-like [Camelina sativa]|uniref:F-box/LRR-repeat protein At3g59210-like n=1 Tax=Camelina sativa TaxID=90675 RepID=A0ABM0ZCB3_CAMSA|nr:PREDICTED: F-box/LRR-repeat protein At3g59210-like [Camelina sativa]
MNRDKCQRRKKSDDEEGDAISRLPEDLLLHILSLLPTREAALTSVLSKRWRDLFTLLQPDSYDFDDSVFMPCLSPEECPRTSFREFVNRVLSRQPNSPITKFSLTCHQGVDKDLVADWTRIALTRGATDLTLIVLFPASRIYSLPSSIFFYSRNLIKLKLGCGRLGIIHHNLFWGDFIFTNLRTLHLDSIDLGRSCESFAHLISRCPMLEELIVNCIRWHHWNSASVCSLTLKTLTIDCEHYLPSMNSFVFKKRRGKLASGNDVFVDPPDARSEFGSRSPHDISFDTPNLLYLNYSDFVARNYPLVKLDSLVEARLDVGSNRRQMHARDSVELRVRWDATNLIMGIQNVQTLHLTSATIEAIEDFCKTVPVFNNLNHLSIESDDERGWQALPLLLINCPSLHTLVFHGLHHRVSDGCGDACDCIPPPPSSSSCLSSCPVKILKILDFGATCGEMSLVEHFLKKLPRLEQVIIVLLHCDSFIEEGCDRFEVSKALEMAPRASPNCKLKVVNN